MKKIFLLALLLGINLLNAQTAFRHLTSTANTSEHVTTLDHPQLNGNPNAVVFVAPSWEENGDQNHIHPFGVWYNGSRWTILNQNKAAMSAAPTYRFRFKVLAFPAATSNTFVHTVSTSNKALHITTLDHPALNNKPNAVVMVTQLYSVANPHEIGVWYDAGRWKIFNQDRVELPVNAKFNVLIGTNGGGINGATAVQHTHTNASKLGAPHPGYTILDHSTFNNNSRVHLFVTQRWIGSYNPYGYNIWYDDPSPNDRYHYRDGTWFVYNSQNEAMPDNAAFNILVVPDASSTCVAIGNDYASVNRATIQGYQACLSADRINGSNNNANRLPSGTLVFYKTGEGRLGKLEVLEHGTNLRLRCVTYNDNGSIYRQNDNLTVRGTWTCDLDSGTEATVGTDFHWQRSTATETYLSPLNKAIFWVAKPGNGVAIPPSVTGLRGWVDMHTHPMSHLAFGKKLMHGAPDIGSIIPAGTRNCNPTDFRARSMEEALGHCNSTHGGWGIDNGCGNYIRAVVISKALDGDFAFNVDHYPVGGGNLHGDHRHEGIETSPNFAYWPHQTSVSHQQMWWEWIKRAYQEGGLRVMVALTVNSELLAEVIDGDGPKDDKASSDLQIDEIKSFVGRHSDFMEVAYNAKDLRRIVGGNKLAVIIGVEVDNIGNFHKRDVVCNETTVKAEIQRLYDKGVRYAFPIHLTDNKFGGAAVYEDLFNFANKYSTGGLYKIQSSSSVDPMITHRLGAGLDGAGNLGVKAALDAASGIPFPPALNVNPLDSRFCPVPTLGCWEKFKLIAGLVAPDPTYVTYAATPGGHVNAKGLTQLGEIAIKEMMRLGMIIDIDHMSQKSIDGAIAIAERADYKYPLNMGHNGLREEGGKERAAKRTIITRMAALGGVFGVGTADTDAPSFISAYNKVWEAMGAKAVGLGSDVNGLEKLPHKSQGINSADFYNGFSKCSTGNRTWDYTAEGVSHYGLMADFLRDVKNRNTQVHENLMSSAEYFARMWEKCDERSRGISGGVAGSRIVQPDPITNLCPANKVAGDSDFGGHGPQVTGDVTLRVSSDGNRLEAVVNISARETQSDWSEVRGTWTRTLYTAATGMRITAISTATRANISQVLAGGGRFEPTQGCDGDEHTLTPGGPVARIIMVGDTGGGDISTDADCNCDTRINRIEFNPVTVTLAPR